MISRRHPASGIRLFLALFAALVAASPLCQARVNITRIPSQKQPGVGPLGPLPCHGFYAYCQRPHNSSRPGMGRLEGGRAQAKPPQELSKDDFSDHRCFCDPECRRYGDCCPDALIATDDDRTLEEFEDALLAGSKEEVREWECHNFPAQETAVYMVGSCPASYGNAIVLHRCHRRVPSSEYGYTLDLPVLSQKTNLTYVNVYCALCNEDSQLVKWGIDIYCPLQYPNCTQELLSWRYTPGVMSWKFHPPDNGTDGHKEHIVAYEIQNATHYLQEAGIRKCRAEVVSSCPAGWTDIKERKLCQSYSLLVKAQNTSRLYKNEHCALCHGELVDHLLCPKVIDQPPEVGNVPPTRIHSYAVLLDFLGDGSQVGAAGVCGIDGLVCGFGELCDQLHRACHVYTCGRMYHMDAFGQCIPVRNSTRLHLWPAGDLPTLDSDCPKLFVPAEGFVRHLNNSVYISVTDRLHNSSEYEVVNSTTILICANSEVSFSWKFSSAQSSLSKFCISLSLFCLVAHIAVNATTPPLRNLPGKNLMCLSIALFVAQLCFEFGLRVTHFEFCIAVSLMIHFGFLTAFMWMNVMAIDVFRTFATATKMRLNNHLERDYEFRIYSMYAWSTAFIIVLMAFTNDFTHWMPGYEPMYGDSLCWINNRQGLFVFFAVPLVIILVANIILFTLTVIAICRTRQVTKFVRKSSSADDIVRMLLYVKLALIMGLTWVFGFVAALSNVEEIWYIFILLNCLQGAFIFFAFSCKKAVYHMMLEMSCIKLCHCHCQRSVTSKDSSDREQRPSLPTIMTTTS